MSEGTSQFQLWRVFAAIACLAGALGLTRFALLEVDRWGGGLFPGLCLVVALLLAVAGVGLLFRRAGLLLLRAAMAMLEILSGL